ncbi:VRR-NUC domain-containing protein [bacterium D16-76]|nr:VRR-NUC domain-containing protein [bacterium D16-76]
MRENAIERRLVTEAVRRGGVAPKFVSPGLDGVPDRLLLFPGGRLAFAEVKAPGKKLRPLQRRRIEQLTALGFQVFVLDRKEQIGEILDEVQAT